MQNGYRCQKAPVSFLTDQKSIAKTTLGFDNMQYLDLPILEHSFYNESIRYELHPDLIFVFGSNEAGRHGKGAARTALLDYGAVYGQGSGLQGMSFAIPTKDRYLRVLPLSQIEKSVRAFKESVNATTSFYFYVTPIGCGLAGYKAKDIAPMFKGITNCWLPQSWKPYVL